MDLLCRPAELFFGWPDDLGIDWSTVSTDDGVALSVFRPAVQGTEDWPDGQFPIVFHHHGQQQEGVLYEHLGEAVADDGAIFVSVAGFATGGARLRAMIDICMLRWLFTADDWDEDAPGTGGASRLDGNVIIMGHSNGGEAANVVYNWFDERPWAVDEDAPEQDMRLCGVAGLAPRGWTLDQAPFSTKAKLEVQGEETVPYLAIEGSLDNDVPGGSLWNSSYSGIDERNTPNTAANVTVWAYDAEHDSFGGGGAIRELDAREANETIQRERGAAIAATWLDAFARRFFFADRGAEGVLYGDDVPVSIQVDGWWNFHPAFAGDPLLFVGARPHQSDAPGELGVREVIDNMARDNLTCGEILLPNGASTSSEGRGFTASNWPSGSLSSDCAFELVRFEDKVNGRYETVALLADFTAPPTSPVDPQFRSIGWDLMELELDDASVLSFRATAVDELDEGACAPREGQATDVDDFQIVFISNGGVEVSVSVSDYARLLAPDTFLVSQAVVEDPTDPMLCPLNHFLQTVRVPLDEVLCPSFPPEDLAQIRFVFDRQSAPEGRAVLLDSVEFHRDLSGAPVCS